MGRNREPLYYEGESPLPPLLSPTIDAQGGANGSLFSEEVEVMCKEVTSRDGKSGSGQHKQGSKQASAASSKPPERLLFLEEPLRKRARLLARRIYKYYMAGTENKPHGHVGRLRAIAERVELACEQQSCGDKDPNAEWSAALAASLKEFAELLQGEQSLSLYELQSSGIIQALLLCLTQADSEQHLCDRVRLFTEALGQSRSPLEDTERAEDALSLLEESSASSLLEMSPPSPAVLLVRKLVQALESREKFPLYSYDNNPPGNVQGFNMLSKRFKVRVERVEPVNDEPAADATSPDARAARRYNAAIPPEWTGKLLKIEPLATVGQLRKFLVKKVFYYLFSYSTTVFSTCTVQYNCSTSIRVYLTNCKIVFYIPNILLCTGRASMASAAASASPLHQAFASDPTRERVSARLPSAHAQRVRVREWHWDGRRHGRGCRSSSRDASSAARAPHVASAVDSAAAPVRAGRLDDSPRRCCCRGGRHAWLHLLARN